MGTSTSNSVLLALEPPLEGLKLRDELLVDHFATANDDCTETWLRTLLKILCGERPFNPLALVEPDKALSVPQPYNASIEL